MGKSVVQKVKACYFCGRINDLERHHIFAGTANRPISEKYGLWVYLCHNCHTGKAGAQYDKEKNLKLKQEAQRTFEKDHSRVEWMNLIRKNYLG